MAETRGSSKLDIAQVLLTHRMCLLQDVPQYASELSPKEYLELKPLKGLRVGVIRETLGEGVDLRVASSVKGAVSHLEELGAAVKEVNFFPAPSSCTHLVKTQDPPFLDI